MHIIVVYTSALLCIRLCSICLSACVCNSLHYYEVVQTFFVYYCMIMNDIVSLYIVYQYCYYFYFRYYYSSYIIALRILLQYQLYYCSSMCMVVLLCIVQQYYPQYCTSKRIIRHILMQIDLHQHAYYFICMHLVASFCVWFCTL